MGTSGACFHFVIHSLITVWVPCCSWANIDWDRTTPACLEQRAVDAKGLLIQQHCWLPSGFYPSFISFGFLLSLLFLSMECSLRVFNCFLFLLPVLGQSWIVAWQSHRSRWWPGRCWRLWCTYTAWRSFTETLRPATSFSCWTGTSSWVRSRKITPTGSSFYI